MIIRKQNSHKKDNIIESFNKKIICGDTLSILKKIPDESVNLIITSPSYYLGKKYEDYESFEQYIEDHKEIIRECKRVLTADGGIFWNVAQTLLDKKKKEITPLGAIFYNIFKEEEYFLKNWIIWKFEGGETPSSRLFGRYENILWFVKDKFNFKFNLDDIRIPSKWINDKRCNENGKNPEDFWEFDFRSNQEKLLDLKEKLLSFIDQMKKKELDQVKQLFLDDFTRDLQYHVDSIVNSKEDFIQKNLSNNIWFIPRVTNNNRKEKIAHPETGCTHPCPFPEELVKRVIKAASDEGDIVLDIFMGSGTVCKVAEELNRNWVGIEKDSDYCDIAKIRIESAINTRKATKGEKKITDFDEILLWDSSKKQQPKDKIITKSKEKFADLAQKWD